LFLSYRGSVNSWECDENDHLNVRCYVEKHWQTLLGAARALNLSIDPEQMLKHVSVQHLRFLQESRLATPLSGYAGVVAAKAGHVDVLTQLCHSFTEDVLCTCVHRIAHVSAPDTIPLPTHAQPRGVTDADLPYGSLTFTTTAQYGFFPIGLGFVSADECVPDGVLKIHNYMARLSDGMPHLWAMLQGEESDASAKANEGGAVLEYRMRYHQPLLASQRFAIHSGLLKVAPKVQNFAHLFFNADNGALCVSAEAAAVRMDLVARKAIMLSPDRLANMKRHILHPLK
jgi:acyl-CoA thioester hydrolase